MRQTSIEHRLGVLNAHGVVRAGLSFGYRSRYPIAHVFLPVSVYCLAGLAPGPMLLFCVLYKSPADYSIRRNEFYKHRAVREGCGADTYPDNAQGRMICR